MKFAGFKIEDAVAFAAAHGLRGDADTIRRTPIHPSVRGKQSVVRKGEFVDLFTRQGLLEEFFEKYWPAGRTAEGSKFLKKYLSRKALNDEFLARAPIDPDVTTRASSVEVEQLEAAAEVTFGLERDLQTALRSNIQQLESGLQVADGGKERTCDAGRIDITARDAQGLTVVIELRRGSRDQRRLRNCWHTWV